MIIIILPVFCIAILIGAFIGMQILAWPSLRRRVIPQWRQRSVLFCFLLSGLFALLAQLEFSASHALQGTSMLESTYKAIGAIAAMGLAISLAMAGVIGCIVMVAARGSRNP